MGRRRLEPLLRGTVARACMILLLCLTSSACADSGADVGEESAEATDASMRFGHFMDGAILLSTAPENSSLLVAQAVAVRKARGQIDSKRAIDPADVFLAELTLVGSGDPSAVVWVTRFRLPCGKLANCEQHVDSYLAYDARTGGWII